MTTRPSGATRKRRARRSVAAPKLPPAQLTHEQRQEAHARLDRLIELGCWPIVLLGEQQDGTVLPLSAPMSSTVTEGMALRIARVLFPEYFE